MFFCELDIWKHRSLFALLVLPFSALASDTSELVLTVQAGGGVAQDVIDPILEFIRMPDVVSGVSLLILIAGLGC